MARIAYPDYSTLAPATQERLVKMGSLNVTRMMSHAEGVMLAYSKLGTELLLKGALDRVLREAVILRVGQLCQSDYEWHQHASVALVVGMDPQMLENIRLEHYDALPADFQIALRFAEEIHTHGAVTAPTLREGEGCFDRSQLVELLILIGYYRLTAGFLKSLDIEIEDGPPLGDAMRS